MIIINGKEEACTGMTLAAYLDSRNYDSRSIAVERNGSIVPKVLYTETIIEDGDCIEVVSFVGGG